MMVRPLISYLKLIQTRIRLGNWKARLMGDPLLVMDAYLDCTQRRA